MIKAIVQFIENKTSFVKGATLQVGWRPDSAPDRCIVVIESGGGEPIPLLPDREDKMVQIISRGLTYFNARDDAYEVYNAIRGAGWQLPEVVAGEKYEAMSITAVSIPQYIGPDKEGRREWSTNYMMKIEDR